MNHKRTLFNVVAAITLLVSVSGGLSASVQSALLATAGIGAPRPLRAVAAQVSGTGAVGGDIWLDEDGDGYREAGEAGIPNVVMNLYQGGNIVNTTKTDSTGGYLFTELQAGEYDVAVVLGTMPPGLAANVTGTPGETGTCTTCATATTVALVDGEARLEVDFGFNWAPDVAANSGYGAIGDRVWMDADGDGRQDFNELGLAGLTVELYRDRDADGIVDMDVPWATAQTDVTGHYIFDDVQLDDSTVLPGLPPGIYMIQIAQWHFECPGPNVPCGELIPYSQTGDPDAELDNQTTTPILLAPGDVIVNVDFGYQPQPGSISGISGTVWDPVAGVTVAGVTVALKDATDNVVATDVSDGNGTYAFPATPAPGYSVWVNDSNYMLGPQISVSGDETVWGQVWEDDPVNGIEGVTVLLYDADGDRVGRTTADGNGAFQFEVEPGSYAVGVSDDDGVLQGYRYLGAGDDRGATELGTYGPFNFPYSVRTGSLGNWVWHDANKDGIQQPGCNPDLPPEHCALAVCGPDVAWQACLTQVCGGAWVCPAVQLHEPRIPGVALILTIAYTGVADPIRLATKTDGDGFYRFDIPDENGGGGTYTVTVAPPPGLAFNPSDRAGEDWDSDNPWGERADPVQGLYRHYNYDFGFTAEAMIVGDRVWLDEDGDLFQDVGEPGVPNVEINLYIEDSGQQEDLVVASATGLNGRYNFTNVPAETAFDDASTFFLPDHLEVSADTLPDGLAVATGPGSPIPAMPGSNYREGDFGLQADPGLSIVGDTVWSDADGDGVHDPGEPGIGGVTLELVHTGDETVVMAATTAPDGSYYLRGALPGEYMVCESGGARCSPPFRVQQGTVYLNADLGYIPDASYPISGRVWYDRDFDGVQDPASACGEWDFEPAERGVPGVMVDLLDADGLEVATTTTDEDGAYAFDGVPAGDYRVQVRDTNGKLIGAWARRPTERSGSINSATGTTDATLVGYARVTLPQASPTSVDFGYGLPRAIGGTVFADADDDGYRDPGEPGVAGVSVELYDEYDALVTSTSTDDNGFYLFSDPVDTYPYEVRVGGGVPAAGSCGLPAGIQVTADNRFWIDPTQDWWIYLEADFGYWGPTPPISGAIWHDRDADGRDDGAEEPPLPGVRVAVVDAAGKTLAATATDAQGAYAFAALPADARAVQVTDNGGRLEGYRLTGGLDAYPLPAPGEPGFDDMTQINIGYVRDGATGSISGTAWADADRDGVQDAAEAGIAGLTLRLAGVAAGETTLLATTTTDEDGRYRFDRLAAGVYEVEVSVDPGDPYDFAAPVLTAIVLSEGEDYQEADFYTYDTYGAVGDRVWYDADGDGVQDRGEAGIGGVEINITAPDGFATIVGTEEDGSWLAPGLGPGIYTIGVNVGTLPTGFSAAPTNGAATRTLTLPAGTDVLYADFGFEAPAGTTGEISGTFFLDEDSDGAQTAAEAGMARVTLDLYSDPDSDGDPSDGGLVASTATDADGDYAFAGVQGGSYVVQVTDQDGFLARLNQSADPDVTDPCLLVCSDPFDPGCPLCDGRGGVTMAAGSSAEADFGYAPAGGAIGDRVWHDLDGDGVAEAGEPGIEGAVIELWHDVNGDGAITPGVDNYLRNAVSDERGHYLFTGLPRATYVVDLAWSPFPQGHMTSGTPGADGNSQAVPYAVALTSADPSNFTADLGFSGNDPQVSPYVPAELVGGLVFEDVNGNGQFDAGTDTRITPVEARLFVDLTGDGVLDPEDLLIGSTTAGDDGEYRFTDLPSTLDYIVAVDARHTYLNGFFQTTQAGSGAVQPVTLGQFNHNFGFHRINTPPAAEDDSGSTDEETVLTVAAPGVLGNDSDPDTAGPLTISAYDAVSAEGATVVVGVDGSYSYDPNGQFEQLSGGQQASDSFTYTVNDTAGDSDTATVSITVFGVNDAAVAADDSYSTYEDAVLNVNAPGVLANDSDIDGDPLTAVPVTGPSHGTLTLNADGSFSYVPGANYNGSDSFTYKANDGAADSNVVTVQITISAVNDAPVAADDAYSTNEDTALNVAAPGVLGNDSDVEGDTLTAVPVTGPSHGTLTLNADGSFTYTPDPNYNGSDSVTYKAGDGAAESNIATVNIMVNAVNDLPMAADDSDSTDEDTLVTIDVLANDTDVDGDTLTVAAATQGGHGSVTNNGTDVTYTPDTDYCGSDSFTYTASDGNGGTDTATVSVSVTCVNDGPVASDDSATTDEDAPVTIDVLANDTDVEGDPLSVDAVTQGSNGSVTNNGTDVTYTPDADFCGSDSFTYTASDGNGGTDSATVSVSVTCVNDAPVAKNDSTTTDEDTPVTIDVLPNDTDVDGDTLNIAAVTQGSNGSVTNNGTDVTYTPDADFCGSDSFTYTVSDGNGGTDSATVSVSVTCVNDAPVASDDSATTNEDTPVTIDVLANDIDVDGGTLSAALASGPVHGTLTLNADGSFSYTPNADFHGSDTFTYKANDGAADSNIATVEITVNPVNDAPAAADDAYSTNEDTALNVAAPGLLGDDSDVDGDTLAAVLVNGTANGTLTLNADGSFTYTPGPNYNGSDSFTYKANDGAADSNVATVDITVNPVNDAPVAADESYSTNEDAVLTLAAPGVLGNDSDIDGDTLSAALVSGPSHGTLTLNADGSFTYTPDTNYNGGDSFTYKASDGAADSSIATVDIMVNPVNDAPVAADDAYSTNEDTTLNVAAPGVLGNDSDVERDTLTAVLESGPSHGTLTLNADGSFSYAPDADYNGSDTFTYKASDGTADSNITTVTITVNPVNDPPVLAAIGDQAVDEESTLSFTASASDPDLPANTLSFSLAGAPAGAGIDPASGEFAWTPSEVQGPDSYTFDVCVSDGALSDCETITVTVSEVNRPPVLDAIGDQAMAEESTLSFTASASDLDIPANALTFSLAGAPTGAIIHPTSGAFAWTPSEVQGPDSYTFDVCVNDGALSDCETITVTVSEVNRPPVLDAIGDKSLLWGDSLAFTASASDPDLPANGLTFSLIGAPADATINPTSGAFAWTPRPSQVGAHTLTVRVSDDGTPALYDEESFTVVVEKRPTALVYDGSLSGQYSDFARLSATLAEPDGTPIAGKSIDFVLGAQNASATTDDNGEASVLMQLEGSAGTYTLEASFGGDGQYVATSNSQEFTIEAEDAKVAFHNDNPVAVAVALAGGNSGQFELTVYVKEAQPDQPGAPLAAPGDIGLAEVSMSLVPVGPGGSADGVCGAGQLSGSGYDAVLQVTCSFDEVPVNTYTAEATVGGGYYAGAAEDVLVVYDPSLGFATGGGWFYWPGSEDAGGDYLGDRTNFGFTMKYNKKGTNVQGSLLLIRHLADGTIYRVKSNALYGLALGQDPDKTHGWASFSGKATYLEPGWLEPEGNYEFLAYVEDRNEPGAGIDRLWIEVRDKDGLVVPAMSMARQAEDNAVWLQGGNIAVPH